jgi:hypothetical protein
MAGKFKHILLELKGHLPFTALGTVLGIVFMLLFKTFSDSGGHALFMIFHPLHVVLSAIVSASILALHGGRKNFIFILIISYLAAVGTATVSDIVMPHIGASLLGLDIPSEGETHHIGHAEGTVAEGDTHAEHGMHLGFIKEWYLVNPAAIFGILIGYFLPHTKFPHAGHIFISTWASLAYLLMRVYSEINIFSVMEMFVILFLSVWIPCVTSDIIFPLLFVRPDVELAGVCPVHKLHSHPHTHEEESRCQ